MDPPHNCSLDHCQIPPRYGERSDIDGDSPDDLIPYSYDATELANAISAIVRRDEFTSDQSALIYEFVADYLSAPSTDDMTSDELQDFLYVMLMRIDDYFFQGGLTLGPEDLYIDLIPLDQPRLGTGGFYLPMKYIADRIVIYLRNADTGRRRSKNDLLTTLTHEMAYAYLHVFFNRCPERGELNLVFGDGGPGVLWQQIFQDMCTHMQSWHPSLIGIGTRPESIISEKFLSAYYRFAGRLPWISSEWEVTNLRWFEPNIFRFWYWRRTTRKVQFKKALLQLSYDDYTHFVSTRVPYPRVPYQIFVSLTVLIICLKVFGSILPWSLS
ncbi:hypothetical protein F4860DRAFT_513246 [Xylaria cubensis]|nr:hypothetical protein F4860DRAFT_513246 [Xylaria cubensis]